MLTIDVKPYTQNSSVSSTLLKRKQSARVTVAENVAPHVACVAVHVAVFTATLAFFFRRDCMQDYQTNAFNFSFLNYAKSREINPCFKVFEKHKLSAL